MKFFKHFTDAHSGETLMEIRRKLGMAGVGQWWTLIEVCAQKLEKRTDEEFTKDHCVFQFDRTHLGFILGTKPKQLGIILGTFQEHSDIVAKQNGNIVIIEMPKLLECLDRDYQRARQPRATDAPKKKIEIKKKKEEEEGGVLDFPEQETEQPEPAGHDPNFQFIIDLWNEIVKDLPPITTINLNSERWRAVKARTSEMTEPHQGWRELLTKVNQSDFLTGRNEDWMGCDFDWVVKKKNFDKIQVGKYPQPKAAKSSYWVDQATKITKAIVRFDLGTKGRQEFAEHLGELLPIACKVPGGIPSMRSAKHDEYFIKKLAGQLKEAAEQLQRGTNATS